MRDADHRDPDLWNLVGGPKDNYCCQDAYASAAKTGPTLHTSGCPCRCSRMVPVPDAAVRRLPAAYPCGRTKGDHSLGDCWMPVSYRAEGVSRA